MKTYKDFVSLNEEMAGHVTNIETDTIQNTLYRNVVYTSSRLQLVLMSIEPGQDIGVEIHEANDQFIRVEAGIGIATVGEATYQIEDGSSIIIPQGVKHNIVNTGKKPLKLYLLYSPPQHDTGLKQREK